MSNEDLERRKILTFAQAEGAAALPRQLMKNEVPQALRAKAYALIKRFSSPADAYGLMNSEWSRIWQKYQIDILHQFVSPQRVKARVFDAQLLEATQSQNYVTFYELVQFLVRHPDCPKELQRLMKKLLDEEKAGFRLMEDTLIPFSSEAEVSGLRDALSAAKVTSIPGPYAHLAQALDYLGKGHWAQSIVESIHAVESATRVIEGSGKVQQALEKLVNNKTISVKLKAAIKAMWDFTNDENGLRHGLLEQDGANVSEADAIYMLTTCAAFVAYLFRLKGVS